MPGRAAAGVELAQVLCPAQQLVELADRVDDRDLDRVARALAEERGELGVRRLLDRREDPLRHLDAGHLRERLVVQDRDVDVPARQGGPLDPDPQPVAVSLAWDRVQREPRLHHARVAAQPAVMLDVVHQRGAQRSRQDVLHARRRVGRDDAAAAQPGGGMVSPAEDLAGHLLLHQLARLGPAGHTRESGDALRLERLPGVVGKVDLRRS